ncbi:MAG: hypothetical protein HGA87_04975 [Desulfobulbaceae bacterium]|nr:hypothetical protein [Desulfobulbaceae bacterium]
MPTPSEHKTIQARILAHAEAIGWSVVSCEKAELRREFDPEVPVEHRAMGRSLLFDDLLDTRRFEIPIPLTEEKIEEMANVLITLEEKVATPDPKCDQLQGLFRTRLHELMTAKIRVHELDINEKN